MSIGREVLYGETCKSKCDVVSLLFWIIPKEVLVIIFKSPVAPLEDMMYPCVRYIQKPNRIVKSWQELFFNPQTGKIYICDIISFVGPKRNKIFYKEIGPKQENIFGKRNTLMYFPEYRRWLSVGRKISYQPFLYI